MGNNASTKLSNTHGRSKKNVHWKAAEKPSPPGKPYIKTNYSDHVMLAWDLPASDGGAPILGYTVEHKRTGSPQWIKTAPRTVLTEVILHDLESGWKYQFRVFAHNACGSSEPSELSEQVTVTFQRTVVIAPRFINELENRTIIENEKLEYVIGYEGIPAPAVCWYKDGFEIFSSRRTKIITENGRSVLIIYQASLVDEGEIKCTATNKIGYATTRAFLIVEAPPKVRLPKNSQDGLLYELGECIRLKVSVAGKPPPEITWLHNGETLDLDPRMELSNVDQTSTLKISDARREDRGEYQIKATNKLDEFIASILVSVTDRPTPPLNVRVRIEGKVVVLNWDEPHDDGGCKIGNYIIEYYKTGWNVWLKAVTSRTLGTELDSLIEGAEYKFRVKAENPYGVSDPSESSDPIFIPDVKRGIFKPQPASLDISKSQNIFDPGDNVPVRPKRTPKSLSSPVTPEMSPRLDRKEKAALNDFFERESSAAREMYYGSPSMLSRKRPFDYAARDFMLQKHQTEKEGDYRSDEGDSYSKKIREFSPVEIVKPADVDQVKNVKVSVANNEYYFDNPSEDLEDPRDSFQNSTKPLQNYDLGEPQSPQGSDVFGGSSEFMLVLLPNEKQTILQKAESLVDFSQISQPPPISLSAPELSEEPPSPGCLRRSVSSSEILHERSCLRFYNEMQIDRIEKSNRDIVEKSDHNKLEVKVQLRRRLSGGEISTQLLRQKRLSWNKDDDNFAMQLKEIISEEQEQQKSEIQSPAHKSTSDFRSPLIRQRSASEEMEEEEFEFIRAKMGLKKGKDSKGGKIKVATENLWEEDSLENDVIMKNEGDVLEDDEEDESELESDSDSQRLKKSVVPPYRSFTEIEEEETYRPVGMRTIVSQKIQTVPKITVTDDDERTKEEKIRNDPPFEILRRPSPLPDPNLVPKPILKKKSTIVGNVDVKLPPVPLKPVRKAKEGSFLRTLTETFRGKKSSKTDAKKEGEIDDEDVELEMHSEKETNPKKKKEKAKAKENKKTEANKAIMEIDTPQKRDEKIDKIEYAKTHKIDLISSPGEEKNVAISHYGDILKEYSNPSRKPRPLYLSTEALKAAATYREMSSNSEEDDEIEGPSEEAQPQKIELAKSMPAKPTVKLQMEQFHDDFIQENVTEKAIAFSPNKFESFQSQNNINNVKKYPEFINSNGNTLKSELKSLRFETSSPVQSKTAPMRALNENEELDFSVEPKSFEVKEAKSSKNTQKNTNIVGLHKGSRLYSSQIMVTSTNQLAHSAELYHQFELLQKIEKQTVERKHLKEAEAKVRSIFEYITDFSMFLVACWFYFFKDERLAIPVLILMVYRQLSDEIKAKVNQIRIPNWLRFFKRE